MANILIRDVPDQIHAALQHRAEDSGQSLQQFLMSELGRVATTPTLEQILSRIARRRGGRVGFARASSDLDEARDSV
jgi:hypothetical protein